MSMIIFIGLFLISFSGAAEEERVLDKEEVIEIALENSRQIARQEEEVEIARAKIKEARGGLFPSIDLNTSYTRLGEAPERFDFETMQEVEGSKDNYSFQLSLQQPLYMGVRIWSGVRQGENNLEAAQLELREKKREVTYDTLEQYYGVLRAEKMLEVAKQRVRQSEHFLKVAEANKEAGIFTRTDVLQARVGYNRARQAKMEAKNGLEMAKEALKNTLGFTASEELKLKADLEQETVKKKWEVEEAYQYALDNRLQLQVLKLQKDSLDRRLQVEKKDRWLPSLNLNAGYETQGDELEVTDGDWQVTVGLNYNIFSGGQKSAQVDQAKGQLNQFETNIKQLKDGIRLEVKEAILNLEEAKDQIALTELNLEEARENLEHTELRFEEGINTTSEVLEAETTFRQIKSNYYQALYDYNLAVVRQDKVLGRPLINGQGEEK